MKKQCSQCMKIKECMQGTLIGKEESIDVWLCRECRSGAKKEAKVLKVVEFPLKKDGSIDWKNRNEAMEYASCVDTQSHLKKCGKCRGEDYKQGYDAGRINKSELKTN